MNIKLLNIYLLVAWLLITAGGIMLNTGAGMVASGVVLAMLVIFLAHRFGVYAQESEKP